MKPIKTIQFKRCRLLIWHQNYCETIFDDGFKVRALAGETEEDVARAKSLGYESTIEMCREHEFLHTFLAEKLNWEYSPTLYAVAHNASQFDDHKEEAFVLAFQAFMNVGRQDDELKRLIDKGLDLEQLVVEAKFLLRR